MHQAQAYECCEVESENWLRSFKVVEHFTPHGAPAFHWNWMPRQKQEA